MKRSQASVCAKRPFVFVRFGVGECETVYEYFWIKSSDLVSFVQLTPILL